jgi:flagellin-like protein
VTRKSRGILGIEAALILIAITLVAGFLAYSVINIGSTTVGNVKTTIGSSLGSASSALQPSGTIIGMMCLEGGTGCGQHQSLSSIIIPMKLSVGGTPVDLSFSSTAVKYVSNSVEYDDIYNGTINVETPLVHVMDTNNFRGQVLDADGNYLSQFSGMGGANGIDVTKSGVIYVADTSNNQIQIYDSDGSNPFSFGGFGTAEGLFNQPFRVTHDLVTGRVVVGDTFNNRIQVFDSSGSFILMFGWGVDTGAAVFEICTAGCQAGSNGFGAGQFWLPVGVSTDGTNIYVADLVPTRVQVFDLDGNFLNQFPTAANPVGIKVDGNSIFVSEFGNIVEVFDLDGNLQFSFGTGGNPWDVDTDASGNIYVLENANHRVQIFDPAGNPISTIGSGPGSGDGQFQFPFGLAVTSYNKDPSSTVGIAAGRQIITTSMDSIYGPSASDTSSWSFFIVSNSQINSILEKGEHGVIVVAFSPLDRPGLFDKLRAEVLTASGATLTISVNVPGSIQSITELG